MIAIDNIIVLLWIEVLQMQLLFFCYIIDLIENFSCCSTDLSEDLVQRVAICFYFQVNLIKFSVLSISCIISFKCVKIFLYS